MTTADPGAQVVTRYRLILPASSKITARDAIHHGGRTYEVHGNIAPHPRPRTPSRGRHRPRDGLTHERPALPLGVRGDSAK